MKLEMRTDICGLIQPDSYGTNICFEVRDGMMDEAFEVAKSVGQKYLDDILEDTIHFSKAKATVTGVWSPHFYNFETDSLEFDLEIGDWVIPRIAESYYGDRNFFEYCKNEFGSRDGIVSFYPYEPEKFFAALCKKPYPEGNYDLERAIGMVISFEVNEQHDVEDWQNDYIDDWIAAMREDGDIPIDEEDEEFENERRIENEYAV